MSFYGQGTSTQDTGFRRKFLPSHRQPSANGEGQGTEDGGELDDGKAQPPKRRADLLDFESQINRVQVVQSTTLASKQAGFYCEACNLVFKDNQAFLEHVNSRMHQIAIGMSLQVRRATVEEVRERLEMLRYKRRAVVEFDFSKRIESLRKHEEDERQRKREERKRRREGKRGNQKASSDGAKQTASSEDYECFKGDGNVDDMAALMGFSGFNSTKRR